MIQHELEMLGKYGCYFLCLRHLGNQIDWSVLNDYRVCLSKKYIDEECTVLQPGKILELFDNKQHKVTKTTTFDENAKYHIAYFFNKRTGLHHFVIMKDENTVFWDPIGDSTTVKEGVVESWRNIY